jgi:hypothetical protein
MSESQAATQKAVRQTETSATANSLAAHRVVSRAEWLQARTALLVKEKASRGRLRGKSRPPFTCGNGPKR